MLNVGNTISWSGVPKQSKTKLEKNKRLSIGNHLSLLPASVTSCLTHLPSCLPAMMDCTHKPGVKMNPSVLELPLLAICHSNEQSNWRSWDPRLKKMERRGRLAQGLSVLLCFLSVEMWGILATYFPAMKLPSLTLWWTVTLKPQAQMNPSSFKLLQAFCDTRDHSHRIQKLGFLMEGSPPRPHSLIPVLLMCPIFWWVAS